MAKTYNITEVGTLTNNNGVISGFSSSDYAITPVTFNWGDNWELQIKFTYVSAGRTQTLIAPEEGVPYGSILMIPNEWGNFRILLGSNNSSWDIFDSTVFNVNDGDTYWIKLSYNGSMYVCEYSDDGTTWTSTNLSSTSTQVYDGLGLRLGLEGYGNSNPWAGSIDLNECYVKINNTIVWEGTTTSTYTGTHIQLRHDTASNWSNVNPTLLEGEVGIETDTNKMKIGDGSSAYNSLTYFGGGGGGTVDQTFDSTSANAQSGVAINSFLDGAYVKQTELTTPMRYGSKNTLQVNTSTNVLRLNPIGFLSGGAQTYPTISYSTLLIPTIQRGNRVLDTRNVMYYIGDIKDKTIYFQNEYSNSNSFRSDVIIGKLASDGTFTPYYWTDSANNALLGLDTLSNTGNNVQQGVVETYYNTTATSFSSTSATGSASLDYVTISEVSGNTNVSWNRQTGSDYTNDRTLYTSDRVQSYETFDANCVIFCLSTTNNVYFANNFYITDNNSSTIWAPTTKGFPYATVPLGAGLTVNSSGNLVLSNPIVPMTQNDYDNMSGQGVLDINTLYIVLDTGAIYYGYTLVAQKN